MPMNQDFSSISGILNEKTKQQLKQSQAINVEETKRRRQKVHEENTLAENQCQNAKQFMKQVMYQVPLNQLYRVIASCMYSEDAQFCPVLVKIVDSDILKENSGKPYLLQVWNQRGEMIYERSMANPVANWNICGNKLLFME